MFIRYEAVERMAVDIMTGRTMLTDRDRYMLGVEMLMNTDSNLCTAISLHFGQCVLNSVKSRLFHPWYVPPDSQHLVGHEQWSHEPVFDKIDIGNLIDLHEAAHTKGYRTVANGRVVYFVKM